MGRRLAVVGGGWAGLATAVRARQLGLEVSLFEMSAQLGGRARSLPADAHTDSRLDNGQHILIGAYQQTLALMQTVGVDVTEALLRTPLRLRYPDHEGLHLPPGPALIAFTRGVLAYRHWPLSARLRLLAQSLRWMLQSFRCPPGLSVQALCRALPAPVQEELIEPLCVAALNTPAAQASAQVFLRVLQDALFSGPGSADLLLPRWPLSALLAEPAQAWLTANAVKLHLGNRVQQIQAMNAGWQVDGQRFDAVVLACPAAEAARLAKPQAADWAAQTQALPFEPIITVYLCSPGTQLPAPMVALRESSQAPAQFIFDLGQLGNTPGRFAMVISGAARWVERGLEPTGEAALAQALTVLRWATPPSIERVLAEKRATFACTPGLKRPPSFVTKGLWAAGDYVDGPYPATLEGAVRSGFSAAQHAADQLLG